MRKYTQKRSSRHAGVKPLLTELSSIYQFGLSSLFLRDSSLPYVFVIVSVYVFVIMSWVTMLLYSQNRCEFVCSQESHEWDGGGRCSGRPGEVKNEGERYWIDG